MTLRLTVDRSAWLEHVQRVASVEPGIVPVIKGNGYGFGRRTLFEVAASIGDTVCLGTVHEVHEVPSSLTALVLTPTPATPDLPRNVMLTVASATQVETATTERVFLKLRSSVSRFGFAPGELHAAEARCRARGTST